MRSPSWPRITGRLEDGPNQVPATPGRPSRVSPRVPARRRLKASPVSTVPGVARLRPRGLPVTTTGSRRAEAGTGVDGAGPERATGGAEAEAEAAAGAGAAGAPG